jgi:GNAT superfamily N-acetyltransferase
MTAAEPSRRWRRAVGTDLPALAAFLEEAEDQRAGFSGRLLRKGLSSAPSLRLPSPLRGAVWIAEAAAPGSGPSLTGAVLCHPSRLAFPVFPPEWPEGDRAFALLASSFSAASAIGMAKDVMRYEAAMGVAPRVSVAYRLMSLAEDGPPPLPRSLPAYPGLTVRRATLADLDALAPLQEAYEREEVLTPIHALNPAACRAALARALERQLVFAALEGGTIVGKAGTNARGFRVDQVGGVYTLPARRGRGVATALMAALLAEILDQGRRPSLFVKPSNLPARYLYLGLGFEDAGDYRADYFEA